MRDKIKTISRSNTFINLGGFAVVALCGVLINLLMTRSFSVEAVGTFSYFYSLLIVFSQFNTFGLHYSALKFLAEGEEFIAEKLTAGLVLCLLSGSFFFLVFLGFSYFVSELPKEPYYIPCAALGILIFSVNKYFLFCLNGLHYLKDFAVFNTSRYILTLVWILSVIFYFKPENPNLYLCSTVLIPEIVLFFLLSYRLKRYVSFKTFSSSNAKQFLFFGIRGMWTGALSEVNTKVDILFITHFLGMGAAGIYAIPTMIFEGVAQLPSVFRNMLNPKISKLYKANNLVELDVQIKKYCKLSLYFVPLFSVAAILAYPIYVKYFVQVEAYMEGWSSVIVLLSSLIVTAYLMPLQMFLIQAGHPGKQSIFLFLTVVLNIVLNIIFVPNFGILGAAMATAITGVVGAVVNKFMVIRILAINKGSV